MTEHASQLPPLPQEPPQAPPKGGGGGKLAIIIIACVIVVVTVVSLGLAVLMSKLRGALAMAQAVACKANLKEIGTATLAYQEQANSMPLIKSYEVTPNGANIAPTRANQTDERYSSGQWESTLGDQAIQNVWLLVANKLADEEMFRCKGDRDWQPRGGVAKYGWTDPHQYSYGMQWPYQKDAAGNTNAAVFGARDTVMLADRNPGGPVDDSRRPSNHSKTGTNCVLSDGSIATSRKDGPRRPGLSTLGFEGDEIYTNAAGVAGGLPQSATDTSITLSGR